MPRPGKKVITVPEDIEKRIDGLLPIICQYEWQRAKWKVIKAGLELLEEQHEERLFPKPEPKGKKVRKDFAPRAESGFK